MFGKVKRWLNIEGIKLTIECPDYLDLNSGQFDGQIRLVSMEDHQIDLLQIRLIEIYRRGRGNSKRIDEYLLSESNFDEVIQIKSQEETTISFTLNFNRIKSRMESFSESNVLTKVLAGGAHLFKGVRSDFKIEVSLRAPGIAVSPYTHKMLLVK
jgi:hypothetical protein